MAIVDRNEIEVSSLKCNYIILAYYLKVNTYLTCESYLTEIPFPDKAFWHIDSIETSIL